jgi:hypothetical protein
MSRLSAMQAAIADTVWIEQGATTIPRVAKEPLAMLAPISVTGWTTLAIARTSATS